MAPPRNAHDPWPSPATRLLLEAALLDDGAARDAFAQWLALHPSADPRLLADTDRRLLPLLARRLRGWGAGHAWAEAGEGVGRRAAARNERLLGAAVDTVSCLSEAGVDVMVLKGVPLLLEYYGDLALRPMSDIDVMVKPADLAAALDALERTGWVLQGGRIYDGLRPYLSACDFRRADGSKLDVHQHLIEHGSSPPGRQGLWHRGHALDLGGGPCLAPAPADLLFHVCVAGMKFGHNRNSRWIADAFAILQRAGARVDWALLPQEATDRRLILPLRECLGYLARLGAAVPAHVVSALEHLPVRRSDRLVYRLLRRHSRTLGQLFEEYFWLYRSGARAAGHRAGPLRFLAFCSFLLVHRWGLRSVRQLPATSVRRLVGRPHRSPAAPFG